VRTFASFARFEAEEVLSDRDGVLFLSKELDDFTGLGRVYGDVDLNILL
jgi:hypothetical protein